MGVATGCGCKAVYRFLHTTSTPLVSVLFYSSILLFVHLKKSFSFLYKIRIASWPAVHVCEGRLQVGFQPF